MKKLLVVMLLLVNVAGMNGCSRKLKNVDPIDDNYRVFYQIFVGSFSDSNNDGIGDLKGIINRIDYLNDGDVSSGRSLGVQGLWLSPVFESPSYHKYDVKDYYKIDPDFGSMDDLKKLIEVCHERNVKIILDLPFNHTSSQNQWFKDFKDARIHNNSLSRYYDYYVCETSSTRRAAHIYYSIPSTSLYYEGNFSSDMPELNFDNEDVRQEVLDIAEYYLDMGIDGFRFDAAKYIYYLENKKCVEFWSWYDEQLRKINPEVYLIGEVWSSDVETNMYASTLNCFNFTSAGAEGVIASAAKGGNANPFTNYVDKYVNNLKKINPDAMYTPFISNHDMDRSAGYLTMASKSCYMAANLYILCCGSPFIYYGEEIGMRGSRGSENTDANRRLAMLWGDKDTVADPVGACFGDGKQTNGTVKQQLKDENSLLNYYSRVISFRNRYPQIARGSYSRINFTATYLGGFTITYNNEKSYLIHNTTNSEKTLDLSLYSSVKITELIEYIGQGECRLEGNILTVGPQTSVLLK